MKPSILFLSLYSFLVIGCGGNKQTTKDANKAAIEEQDFDQQITEKYWKLIELDGNEVEMAENQEREIFFILKANDNTI